MSMGLGVKEEDDFGGNAGAVEGGEGEAVTPVLDLPPLLLLLRPRLPLLTLAHTPLYTWAPLPLPFSLSCSAAAVAAYPSGVSTTPNLTSTPPSLRFSTLRQTSQSPLRARRPAGP